MDKKRINPITSRPHSTPEAMACSHHFAPHWFKIYVLMALLPKFEWVILVDDDSVFRPGIHPPPCVASERCIRCPKNRYFSAACAFFVAVGGCKLRCPVFDVFLCL